VSTIDNMLNRITGDMCTGFVKAEVRRYQMYVTYTSEHVFTTH